MKRVFNPTELDEMRADMRRNPGKGGIDVVAQLHACTTQEVLQALDLREWPDEHPAGSVQTQSKAVRRRYPASLREKAVNELLDSAESYATVAGRYGVPVSTLHTWIQRSVQQKVTTSSTKEDKIESAKTDLPTEGRVPAPKTHSKGQLAELRQGLTGLGEFMAAFIDTGLLDDVAVERLTLWAKEAKAFVAGAEYMEGHHG